ncbi:hypothetical protein ACHAW6_007410 [Cyclotella cf. meneghiniana]
MYLRSQWSKLLASVLAHSGCSIVHSFGSPHSVFVATVEEIGGKSTLVVQEKTDDQLNYYGWHSDSRRPEGGTPPPSILNTNLQQIEDVVMEHHDQDLLQQTSYVSAPTFIASDLLGTPLLLSAIALGDLNGDGHPDIVRANYEQSDQILFNDGMGNFATSSSLPGDGIASECIALGDVNGDGFVDIVLGKTYPIGNNWLLLNDGTGTNFTMTRLPPLTPHDSSSDVLYVVDVALEDVNKDGHLDVVFASRNGEHQLLLNDGMGNFTAIDLAPFANSTTDSTWCMTLGDVNGDGFIDIVFGNDHWNGQVNRLLLNNGGSGTNFTLVELPVDLEISSQTISITLGDINGDSYTDIVTNKWIYLNDGFGNFILTTSIFQDSWTLFASVIEFGDINSDGHVDVIVGKFGRNTLMLNDGRGNFTSQIELPGYNGWTRRIALGDVNSDGSVDIVVGNYGMSQILLNDGTGSSFRVTDLPDGSPLVNPIVDAVFIDLNGDGTGEIVLIGQTENQVLTNDGMGNFSVKALPGSASLSSCVAVGDMNKDGFPDLVVGSSGSNKLLLNDGMGNFTIMDITESDNEYSNMTYDVAVSDLNGDGHLDIVFANGYGRNQLLLNKGNTEINMFEVSYLPSVHNSTITSAPIVLVGDVNGDGSIDIIFKNDNVDGVIELLLNDGGGNFVASSLPPLSMPIWTNPIFLEDMNDDGHPDLVFSGEGSIQLLLNDGTGNFANEINVTAFEQWGWYLMALDDMNDDGHNDIIISYSGYDYEHWGNQLLLNDGTGRFSSIDLPGSSASRTTVGDVNRDGLKDILLFGNAISPSQILYNTGNNTQGTTVFDQLLGRSITALCSADGLSLVCSASTDANILGGVLKTSLTEGACSAGSPATSDGSEKSTSLNANQECKNSGVCNFVHCFRADYVIYGISVLAEMTEVETFVQYEKDGTFSVAVQIAEFVGTGATVEAAVSPNITATLGACSSTTDTSSAIEIGEILAICVSIADVDIAAGLNLISVTASPGVQTLVNAAGQPNFVTSMKNEGSNAVTLETLMIPVYYDSQGGNAGSITISGTALISYYDAGSRRLLWSTRSGTKTAEKEEATFSLQVVLAMRNESPDVAEESGEMMDSSGVAVDAIITFAAVGLLIAAMGLL